MPEITLIDLYNKMEEMNVNFVKLNTLIVGSGEDDGTGLLKRVQCLENIAKQRSQLIITTIIAIAGTVTTNAIWQWIIEISKKAVK